VSDGFFVDTHSLGNNGPRLIPFKTFKIKENTLKLNNSKCWMGIIQLNSNLVRELAPCTLGLLESTNNIVERRSDPEVLLLKSKLLTTVEVIIGIQDSTDGLGTLLVCNRTLVVTAVKFLEIEFSTGSFAGPETQIVGGMSIESRNRDIVGHSFDDLTTFPGTALLTLRILEFSHMAVELDLMVISMSQLE
jgi:hypothetical protein